MERAQSFRGGAQLIERLVLSADNHLAGARVAFEERHAFEFQRGDSVRLAALHAGIAVELLGKALYVATSSVRDVKRLNVRPTLKSLFRHYPALASLRDGIEQVLDVRNTAAHEATPPLNMSVEEAIAAAESFRRTVVRLLDKGISEQILEVGAAVGEAAAAQVLDERADEAREKIWNAHEAYERQRHGLGAEKAFALDEILLSRPRADPPSTAFKRRDVDCPACEYAQAELWTSSQDGVIEVPFRLACPRCDVHLDSEDLWLLNIDIEP